jgi:DNA primase
LARISDAQKEQIRQRADIVAVIGERVSLTKKGRDFWGCCPFHDEKTPSFLVNPEKQAWYCHGACKRGGDVFTFVKDMEKLSFPEAVRHVARRYGVQIEDETPEERARSAQKINLLEALNRTVDFYRKQLFEGDTESARVARAFLERRGVSEETAQAFAIGVAPQGNLLARKASQVQGMLPRLKELGLVRADGRDFFSHRLLFPIADESGRWVGFGGRRLDEKDEPKFINSRESSIFTKKNLLYGLSLAREAKPRPKNLVVVEGYLDVVIAHQAGCPNVVAVCGLGFGPDHAKLARRFGEGKVVLLFDGDAAGKATNLRILEQQLGADVSLRVALLPEGMDPDDFILKNGKDAFEKLVSDESLDAFRYLVDVLVGDGAGAAELRNEPAKKTAVVKKCAELLAQITDDISHQVSLRYVADRLDYSEEKLRGEVLKARETARSKERPAPNAAQEAAREQDLAEFADPLVRAMLGQHACAGEAFEVALIEALIAGERLSPELAVSAEDFTAGPLRDVAAAALVAQGAHVLDRLHERPAALGVATRLLERVATATDGTHKKDYRAELEGGARALVARRSRVRAAEIQAEIARANEKGDHALVERLLAEKTRLSREAQGVR